MVPWRISLGERLYRDVQFPHGPLAPFVAAGVDHVAGRSLPARMALAALIALWNLAALDRLSRSLLSPGRAALATSVAVAAAVFLRPGGWLFPFSFDMAISVAALTWALAIWREDRSPVADGWSGACLFVALISRLEFGLAGVFILGFSARRDPKRLRRLALLPLAAAAAVYAAVSWGTPLDRLVDDGWLRLVDPPEAFRNVYRAYAGLDRVGFRLLELALVAIVLLVVAAALVAAASISKRLALRSPAAAAAVEGLAILGLVALGVARWRPPPALAETLALFPPLPRAIPICLAISAILRLVARLRGAPPRGPLSAVPDSVLWMAALFGGRLFLAAGYAGPYNAFFLPLPILVATVGLFAIADRAAPRIGRRLPRLLWAALVLFLLFRVASLAEMYRNRPWSRVATSAGALWLPEPIGGTTRLVLQDLETRLSPQATLVGFPEGGFFNYVLNRRNPAWVEQYFPGTLDEAGERRAIAALASRPPDAVVYANVIAVGEGARIFGRDYLVALDAAVRSRSRTAAIYGPGARPDARIGDPDFFVEIRVPLAASP